MSTRERVLHLVQQESPGPRALPRRANSRRALYRVDTRSMDLEAGIRAGGATVRGRLLNVSAAGCCVEVAAPLPSAIERGGGTSVTLHTDAHILLCNAEIISIDLDDAGVEVRLRFRALAPQTHRALLAWINTLVTSSFAQRHTKLTAVSHQPSADSFFHE